MTHFQAAKTLLVMGLVALIMLAGGTLMARADEAKIRAQFFSDAKRANLVNGRKNVNCCGVGDGTSVKVIGSSAGFLAVEITDPRRHPTAKVGEIITVPRGLIAKWPHAPSSLGDVLFLGTTKSPYCFMPQAGG